MKRDNHWMAAGLGAVFAVIALLTLLAVGMGMFQLVTPLVVGLILIGAAGLVMLRRGGLHRQLSLSDAQSDGDGFLSTCNQWLQIIPDAAFILDPHDPQESYPIVACNASACALTGYQMADLVGKSFSLLLPQPLSSRDVQLYWDEVREQGKTRRPGLRRRQDGTVIRVEGSGVLVRDGGRELFLSVERDLGQSTEPQTLLNQYEQMIHVLNSTAVDITSSLQTDRILERLVHASERVFPQALAVTVQLLASSESDMQTVFASSHLKETARKLRFRPGIGIAGAAIAESQVINVPDVRADPRFLTAESPPQFRSLLVAPLISRSRIWGTLSVEAVAVGAFHRPDEVMVNMLARQAGVALENAHLFASESREREVAETLRDIGIVLTGALRQEDVLRRVLEQVARVLPYDAAAIWLAEESGGYHRFVGVGYERFGEKAEDADLWLPEQSPVMRLVKQTRDVLVISDVRAEPEWARREDYTWVRSWAGAPILVRGEAIGVFCLDHTQAGFYRDAHRPILEALAAQISIATENALLFEQVQEYALGLQRKVMERTAEIGVQQERMNAILSSIDDAVIAFGVDGRVSYVNSAVFRMMGWDEAGANGRHVLDFLHQMTSRQTFRETVRAMRKQQSWRAEVVLKHRDGYPVVVDAVGVPYREQTNTVVGYIVSMRRLSDERETERMKARFMSLISHELRTPVTNLKLHLHLVRKTVDNPEKHQHHLAALEHQTARLADMMEKVLRVTRLADSDELLTDELIGFETLLDNVIVRYAEQAKAHDIVLAAENRFDRPVHAQGDERWFSAACCELLENALQYTPPGQCIVARLEPYEQDGQAYVGFSVQDTGPGINAEDLAQLNLSFTRAGDQRSGGTAGMGLGLFLARSVVERLGGGIAVESEPGEGSTFTLYLPEVVT